MTLCFSPSTTYDLLCLRGKSWNQTAFSDLSTNAFPGLELALQREPEMRPGELSRTVAMCEYSLVILSTLPSFLGATRCHRLKKLFYQEEGSMVSKQQSTMGSSGRHGWQGKRRCVWPFWKSALLQVAWPEEEGQGKSNKAVLWIAEVKGLKMGNTVNICMLDNRVPWLWRREQVIGGKFISLDDNHGSSWKQRLQVNLPMIELV